MRNLLADFEAKKRQGYKKITYLGKKYRKKYLHRNKRRKYDSIILVFKPIF